jgi:uncharacterized protein (TIGR03437 family)
VKVNNVTAPLLYADPKQVNFQVPFETAAGAATVSVESPTGASQTFSFTVLEAAPGIFVWSGNRAIATSFDNNGKLNTTSLPSQPGDILTVYLTGPGPLNGSIADGAATPASPLYKVTAPYSATIGNVNATVHFLGMAPTYVGLGQANVQVPSLPAGDYPLVITVNGIASNGPVVSVQ